MLTTTSLQPPNARTKDKAATTRKFSTFIKRMIVELDRDPSTYAEGNVVEVSSFLQSSCNYEYVTTPIRPC